MKKIRHIISTLMLIPLLLLSGCNDEAGKLLPNQGQISFRFTKVTTYILTDLKEIGSVKITLEKEGKPIELASLDFKGNENEIASSKVALEEGVYKIVAYKAYDTNRNIIPFLNISIDKDNVFTVKAGQSDLFILPVKVKEVIDTGHTLYNSLFALCTEVLGEDKTKWPKSWIKGEPIDTWEGLEFEVDEETGAILHLSGLVIDGEISRVYDSENKKWVERGLPEFKNMKKLPSAIVNLTTLESLVIRNCEVEELPEDLGNLRISHFYLENTKVARLPQSMSKLKLNSATFKGNRFTEFPEVLTAIETMRVMIVLDEEISSIPASISNWKNLTGLTINNTKISEIPDVFNDIYKVSTLDLAYNKELKTLPSSLATLTVGAGNLTRKYIRAYILDGCGFTAIPTVIQHENTLMVSIADNKLTNITAEELNRMPNLTTLILNGNQLTSFPSITSDEMRMIALINCGLTSSQVNRTGMPNLYSSYTDPEGVTHTNDFLFFTQEHFNAIFEGNIKNVVPIP